MSAEQGLSQASHVWVTALWISVHVCCMVHPRSTRQMNATCPPVIPSLWEMLFRFRILANLFHRCPDARGRSTDVIARSGVQEQVPLGIVERTHPACRRWDCPWATVMPSVVNVQGTGCRFVVPEGGCPRASPGGPRSSRTGSSGSPLNNCLHGCLWRVKS